MFRPPPPPRAAAQPTSTEAGPSSPISSDGNVTAVENTLPTQEQSMISKMMADNPYFSAGAGLMGIGVVLTTARTVIRGGASLAQRRMLVTLEIPSKDRSYPWFLEWMALHAPQQTAIPSTAPSSSSPTSSMSSSSSSSIQAGTKAREGVFGSLRSLLKGKGSMSLRSHELAVETAFKQHENGSSEAVFNLVPGPGTHYFRYKGSWFQVKRERDAKLMDLHSGSPWETLTLTTLSSSRHLLPDLLSEARALAEQGTEGKTVVYTAWGVEWRPFGKPRRRREMGSVVLAEGVAERVQSDLKGFLGRGKWYAERGIPYRRGYLLYGPPGSGKTSFIQALAGSVNYNICLLNLAERGLTDDKLNHLLGLVPERSFILLEDVDSAFSRRIQTSEDGYKSSVTFSGLLNALDGVASSEERIIFMTTNHYDKLDPALIRPGRVDLHELLDDAAGEQAERLFKKFYGSTPSSLPGGTTATVEKDKTRVWREGEEVLDDSEVDRMAGEVRNVIEKNKEEGKRVSMASLQGLFIRTGAREAASQVGDLCKRPEGEVKG